MAMSMCTAITSLWSILGVEIPPLRGVTGWCPVVWVAMRSQWRLAPMAVKQLRFWCNASTVKDGNSEWLLSGSLRQMVLQLLPEKSQRWHRCWSTTLSCTFLPSDLYAAWCYIQGFPVWEGVPSRDEDRRSQFQQVFAASSQKSWDPCIRPSIQPESRRSELAKQSWEFDVWHQFQPHPERRELARSCRWALSSTRAWKAFFCRAVFKAWNLAMISTKAWREWLSQVAFRAWLLAPSSTRG